MPEGLILIHNAMLCHRRKVCAGDNTARPHVGRCKLPACWIDCDNYPQQCPLIHSTCMYLANLSIIALNKLVASPPVVFLILRSTTFRLFLAYGVSQDIRVPTHVLSIRDNCVLHLRTTTSSQGILGISSDRLGNYKYSNSLYVSRSMPL